MTDVSDQTRDALVACFATFAAETFARFPRMRSLLLSVAQYWNDSADDEVHHKITGSMRDQPVWPHECGEWRGDDAHTIPGHEADCFDEDWTLFTTSVAVVRGEICADCANDYDALYLSFGGGFAGSMIAAVEAFCPEGAHQDMSDSQGHAPFAIARRTDGGIAVERVGRPQRPPAVIGAANITGAPWQDPRALALLREVGRALDDDGPRGVLSDYLLEAHPDEPLGEALALCLAPALDDAAIARRDQLLAEHRDRWLHPLGQVIARGCAELDRGLLRAADVYADDHALAAVAGAPGWATVETVRIAPGSRDVVDPEMRALRDIGPLGVDGVRAIGDAPRPWAIERLHVRAETEPLIDALVAAANLPRLRELAISLVGPTNLAALERLTAAAWWPGLQRLSLLVPTLPGAAARLLPHLPPGKQLAIAAFGAHGQPAGWQLLFDHPDRVELSMVGWHADATVGELRAIVDALPPDRALVLVDSRYRAWRPEDLALLPDRPIRPMLAG